MEPVDTIELAKLRSLGDAAIGNLHPSLDLYNMRMGDEAHRLPIGGAQPRNSRIWAGPAMGGFGSQPKTSGATRRLDALVASPMFPWPRTSAECVGSTQTFPANLRLAIRNPELYSQQTPKESFGHKAYYCGGRFLLG